MAKRPRTIPTSVSLWLDVMAPRVPVKALERVLGVRATTRSTLRRLDPDRQRERWTFEVRRQHTTLLSDEQTTEFLSAIQARPAQIRQFVRRHSLAAQLWLETYVPMGSADVGDLIPLPLIRFAAAAALPINSQFWVIADPTPPRAAVVSQRP